MADTAGQRVRCEGIKRTALYSVLTFFALWLSWSYISAFAAVGYTYLWWAAHRDLPTMPVPATGNTTAVPRIIHQTWKDQNIPEKWKAAQQSCIDHNKDFAYRLWTDEEAWRFIEREYPWFLPTYLSYPYAIQRVDAIRYFILYHYGGVYIDLDMGCHAGLEPLLAAPFTAPLTHPVGISNDVMAAVPGAAFLRRCLHELPRWNMWMGIKYVQVMFSTGPMFLTMQLARFAPLSDVALVSRADYGKYASEGTPLFYHLHGSSWHAGDASFVFWAERHGVKVLWAAATLASLAAVVAAATRWLRLGGGPGSQFRVGLHRRGSSADARRWGVTAKSGPKQHAADKLNMV